MKKIKYIVVHHADSGWGNAETIIHWHTDPAPKGNGWSKPGYHYIINNGYPTYNSYHSKTKIRGWDGKVEGEEAGLVSEKETSNGVLNFNGNAINICLIGNFDTISPFPAQLNSLEILCRKLMKKYNLSEDAVIGHREAIAIREAQEGKERHDHDKTCPGLEMDMRFFRIILSSNDTTEFFVTE